MNKTVENTLNKQLREANRHAYLRLISSLYEKINRLRECYKANQTHIKEAESKSASASDFEYVQMRDTEITQKVSHLQGKLEGYQMFQGEIYKVSGPVSRKGRALESLIVTHCSELMAQLKILKTEQEQVSIALRKSRDAVKFLAILDTLRNREKEIKCEGVRLKEEKEYVQTKIKELELYDSLLNQNNDSETEMTIFKEEITCNVGSKFLRLAEFLFSYKTCKEVFYPVVGDWREDYIIALRKGRILDAAFVAVKIYLNLVYTMVLCSKAGKLIEFIMKLADIIEFFNKFSK